MPATGGVLTEIVTVAVPSVPVGTGLIDMPGVVHALKESGYEGVLAVETDHHKDNQDEDQLVAQSVTYLKKLVAEVDGLR